MIFVLAALTDPVWAILVLLALLLCMWVTYEEKLAKKGAKRNER